MKHPHILTTAAGTVLLLTYLITAGILAIQFDRNVGGHLKRAADANNVELAEKELAFALKNMDSYEGYTSILYRTPDEDLTFWRDNIAATYNDLQSMSPKARADDLIVSNQLIKVRETLLDTGQHGDRVTQPNGTSRFPNNGLMAAWVTLGLCIFTVGVAWWTLEAHPAR